MPVPVRWDVERAAQLYRDGWTLLQLAAEFGMSRSAVHHQLRKTVEMRPARLPLGRPDVSTMEIIRLRDDERLTWPAIAARVGMSAPGVVSRYRRSNRLE